MGTRRLLPCAIPAIAAAALLLAGCTAAPDRSGTPSPTPSTFSLATVTPTALVPVTCDEALSGSEAAALAGTDVGRAAGGDALQTAIERQAGDLVCVWTADDAADAAGPAAGVEVEVRAHAAELAADPSGRWAIPGTDAAGVGTASTRDCDAGPACVLTASVGDFWARITVHPAPVADDGAAPDDGAAAGDPAPAGDPAATLSRLVAALRTAPTATADPAPAGSWPVPVDCAAVSKAARVGVSTGVGRLDVTDASTAGDGVTYSSAVAHLGGRTVCVWTSPDASGPSSTVTATTVSSGAWAAMSGSDDASSLGSAVNVGDDAIGGLRCGDDGCVVTAVVGQNLVRVSDLHRADEDSPTRAQVVSAARLIVQGLRSVYP